MFLKSRFCHFHIGKTLKYIFFPLMVGLPFLSAFTGEVLDYTYFLNRIIDLDSLPLIQDGITAGKFSSSTRKYQYDPNGDDYYTAANSVEMKAGNWLRTDAERREGVMAELEGPGCIFRIWSGNPQGVIRFYLDGDTEPTYEFDFDRLMKGEIEPFNRPFVWQRDAALRNDAPSNSPDIDYRNWGLPFITREGNPASVCYLPIPFAKSCKITSTILSNERNPIGPPRGMYYHIEYKQYPKDWQVETFKLPLKPEYKKALESVSGILYPYGTDPQPKSDVKIIESKIRIGTKKKATILDISGPATIKQFNAKVEDANFSLLRNVILRGFWDKETNPSILTPLGDFFGDALGCDEYKSLPIGVADEMDYCYFRMPFAKYGKITIENQNPSPITLKYRFAVLKGDLPGKTGYFHAKWRREQNCNFYEYPVLETKNGAGVLVGTVLIIDDYLKKWWGEGSEMIYLDGANNASIYGTGTEDYFGDGWGIRWFVNPLSGCPQNSGRSQFMYRWHIGDSIPFSKSIKLTFENYSALHTDIHNGYASVAFWYQLPEGEDFFPNELPEAGARIPSPKIVAPNALEAENIVVRNPGITILDDSFAEIYYSWGRAVRLDQGKSVVRVNIEKEDSFVISVFEKPHTLIEKKLYTISLDGKPVEKNLHLKKGENTFSVIFSPESPKPIIIDYITLTPNHVYITDWLILGPFDNTDDKGYDTVLAPENKLDFATEYDVKDGKARWRNITTKENGYVDFDRLLSPNEFVVAYAYSEIIAPDDMETTLLLGTDDGVKAWLNGEPVHKNHLHRPWRADEDVCKIKLKKGHNSLLIKIDEGISEWGFSARIVDYKEVLAYRLPNEAK
jgi:hypothetical protein